MSVTSSQYDEEMMRQAIRLAMKGRGAVEPNPMVGCVIVKDGRVIGEGYHEKFGDLHAEPNALAACRESPVGATAYVTLEPCCPMEKKTPPCTAALIAAGIARVVIGCLDPNPAVNGKGAQTLRAAGVEVQTGILESAAKQLNAPFFALMQHGRPYVTLKWARSADGKIAGPGGRRMQISNVTSLRAMHKLRGHSDAILVGVKTVINDDPLLTVRGHAGLRQPIRVVLDTHLQTPLSSRLVQTAAEWPLLIYCDPSNYQIKAETVEALSSLSVEVRPIPSEPDGHLSLTDLLRDLGRRSVTHLIVEPGERLARVFLERHLGDRVWVFESPDNMVGSEIDLPCPSAQKMDYPSTGEINLAGDRLTEYLNPLSSVFFSLTPSADFLSAGAFRIA